LRNNAATQINVYQSPKIMKITKNHKFIIGATALAISTIAIAGAGFRPLQGIALPTESSKQQIGEVWQIVNQQYVDGSFNGNNWRSIRNQYLGRNYTSKERSYVAIREMLKKLGDPYTRFLSPQEFKSFKIDTSGQRVGVGIQFAIDQKTKKMLIIAPIEDTAAAKAGIISKDIILKIDGKSTKGIDSSRAVQLIGGKAGTSVTLTIQRGTKIKDYKLVRQQIDSRPVVAKYLKNEGEIGYIRLKQFSPSATGEMIMAIRKLKAQGAQGYIIDLRSNPGGLFYGAIDMAQMFINKGNIVSTKTRQGESEVQTANQMAILPNKPLVVLVDGGSASSSEVLAGALQDNKRAQLVGTKTFGKGLVQGVVPLTDGSGMLVTIAKYYTPNGTDINHKGIQPDVEVKITKSQLQVLRKDRTKAATSADPQYVRALQLVKAKIAAADSDKPA
jgi:carboxyl-terminal processing protease